MSASTTSTELAWNSRDGDARHETCRWWADETEHRSSSIYSCSHVQRVRVTACSHLTLSPTNIADKFFLPSICQSEHACAIRGWAWLNSITLAVNDRPSKMLAYKRDGDRCRRRLFVSAMFSDVLVASATNVDRCEQTISQRDTMFVQKRRRAKPTGVQWITIKSSTLRL